MTIARPTASLPEFRRQADSSFVPLRVTSDHPEQFSGTMSSDGADGVAFTEIAARPHLVERTAHEIVRGGSGYYKVSLLLAGSGVLVQDGREHLMLPGDLTVYDTSRPYSLVFDDDVRNVIMMFPKQRVDVPSQYADQLAAVSLRREHEGLAAVITAYLGQIPTQFGRMSTLERGRLARTSLDLVSTLFTSVLDTDQAGRDPRLRLVQQVSGYIDEYLGDPDLSPGSIAAAHYVSTRHLHAAFQETGTTVAALIRTRRLERSHADLADPVLADLPVFAIAARHGFTDAAHFSRVYKSAYGLPPSATRQR